MDASGQAEAAEGVQRLQRRDAVPCAQMLKDAPCLSWPAVGFWLGKHKFGLPGHLVGSFPQLANKKSERSLCGGWHNAVAEESQLVGAVVTGRIQPGIVQPMGRPISVSTQRGLSLPPPFIDAPACSSMLCLPLS
jgi:hypothetical protein